MVESPWPAGSPIFSQPASPALALSVLAYGDEPVGDPGAVVQNLISTEFERFFSAAGTVLVIHYDISIPPT